MVLCTKILFFTTLLVAIVPAHNTFFKGFGHSKKGFGILGCFGLFAKGVSRKCGNSFDIFNELSKCDGSGNYDQSIDIILKVSKGSADIIDSLFSGFGSLFSNLVIASHRIIFCVLKHSHKYSKHSLCSDNDYGSRWGCLRYSGHYNDIGSVIKSYKLEHCQSDIEELLKKYTNGQGLKNLIGTKRLVAEAIWHIARLFSRDYKYWCLDDAHAIFLKVVTIAGALANSHHAGLGDDVVDGLTSYCNDFFKELGCSDVSTWATNIKKDLEQCDNEDFNGAITNSENGNNNSQQNNQNTNENNSNSNANASNQQSSSNQNNVSTDNKNENNNSQATNVVINNNIYVSEDEYREHEKAEQQKDQ